MKMIDCKEFQIVYSVGQNILCGIDQPYMDFTPLMYEKI